MATDNSKAGLICVITLLASSMLFTAPPQVTVTDYSTVEPSLTPYGASAPPSSLSPSSKQSITIIPQPQQPITENKLIENVMWIQSVDDISANFSTHLSWIRSYGFSSVAVCLGGWDSSGNIDYQEADTESKFAELITAAHAAGLKVYGCISAIGGGVPNIGNAGIRAQMVSQLQTEILSTDCDGHISDIEIESWGAWGVDGGQGTEANYYTIENALTAACTAVGKKGGCYLDCSPYPYFATRLTLIVPNLTVDLIVVTHNNLSAPASSYAYFDYIAGFIPILPHMGTYEADGSKYLYDYQAFWDSYFPALPANFYGFGCWVYDTTYYYNASILTSEWTAWSNWAKKNIAYYTVTASAGTGGSTTYSGANNLLITQTLSFTASPSTGYFFKNWSVSGAVLSSDNPLTYNSTAIVDENYALKAEFEQYSPTDPQIYYVEAYAGQGGGVSPSGQTVVEYPAGDVTLTATANYAYTFTRWKLNNAAYSTDNPLTFNSGTPPNIYVFDAEFTADPAPTPTYTITASAGANGSITNSGVNVVNVGTAYTSLATADADYIFSHWTRAAVLYSTANPISISLSQGESATLAAVFIEDTETPPDPVEPEPTPQPAPPTPSGRFNLLVTDLERQEPYGGVWEAGTWTPGTWDECRGFRRVIEHQEKMPTRSFSSLLADLEKKL